MSEIEVTIKLRWPATPGSPGYNQEKTAEECAELERRLYERNPNIIVDFVHLATDGSARGEGTRVHSVTYEVVPDAEED